MLAVLLMAPVPLVPPVRMLAPPPTTRDQVSLVMKVGKTSLMVAPWSSLGPLLLTAIVYVVLVPGVYRVVPSVLVMARSTLGAGVSVSVEVLLFGLVSVSVPGGVTVVVF